MTPKDTKQVISRSQEKQYRWQRSRERLCDANHIETDEDIRKANAFN
jgi:hypothetical protein